MRTQHFIFWCQIIISKRTCFKSLCTRITDKAMQNQLIKKLFLLLLSFLSCNIFTFSTNGNVKLKTNIFFWSSWINYFIPICRSYRTWWVKMWVPFSFSCQEFLGRWQYFYPWLFLHYRYNFMICYWLRRDVIIVQIFSESINILLLYNIPWSLSLAMSLYLFKFLVAFPLQYPNLSFFPIICYLCWCNKSVLGCYQPRYPFLLEKKLVFVRICITFKVGFKYWNTHILRLTIYLWTAEKKKITCI